MPDRRKPYVELDKALDAIRTQRRAWESELGAKHPDRRQYAEGYIKGLQDACDLINGVTVYPQTATPHA